MKFIYLDKNHFTCHYCSDYKYSNSIDYTTMLTKSNYIICQKCFIREFGKKNLEKLKDKGKI